MLKAFRHWVAPRKMEQGLPWEDFALAKPGVFVRTPRAPGGRSRPKALDLLLPPP